MIQDVIAGYRDEYKGGDGFRSLIIAQEKNKNTNTSGKSFICLDEVPGLVPPLNR